MSKAACAEFACREAYEPEHKIKMKKTLKILIPCGILIVAVLVGFILYRNNVIPRRYTNEDFGITRYVSSVDMDGDGVDDQTDILNGVRAYLKTRPKYKSKYYATGYPDDEYGVCTDVVARGLLAAGYDLQKLMDEDIKLHPENYNIEKRDKNIDFRRVVNMQVYFSHHAISLTTDPSEIEEWQAGDIVVWAHHVGVISDKRNSDGIPYVLHHGSPYQKSYEQDVLDSLGKIIGHYRIS